MNIAPISISAAVNIEAELGCAALPNPEHVCVVGGQKWFEFEASYTDAEQGKTFTLSFWALSMADAKRRIACMRETIAVTGQIHATYPENSEERINQ